MELEPWLTAAGVTGQLPTFESVSAAAMPRCATLQPAAARKVTASWEVQTRGSSAAEQKPVFACRLRPQFSLKRSHPMLLSSIAGIEMTTATMHAGVA
jgi:hypothetical protein